MQNKYGEKEVKEIIFRICNAKDENPVAKKGIHCVGELYKKDSGGCYRMYLVDYKKLVWGWGLTATTAVTQDSDYTVHEFNLDKSDHSEIIHEVEIFVEYASN